MPSSAKVQPSLRQTQSETPKSCFLLMRLIFRDVVPSVPVGVVLLYVCPHHSSSHSSGAAQETQVWPLDTTGDICHGGYISYHPRRCQQYVYIYISLFHQTKAIWFRTPWNSLSYIGEQVYRGYHSFSWFLFTRSL